MRRMQLSAAAALVLLLALLPGVRPVCDTLCGEAGETAGHAQAHCPLHAGEEPPERTPTGGCAHADELPIAIGPAAAKPDRGPADEVPAVVAAASTWTLHAPASTRPPGTRAGPADFTPPPGAPTPLRI